MDISELRERRGAGAVSVAELNGIIKSLFDNNRYLSAVTVRGEISNFTNHRSGHLYFTLKDEDGQIRAVMFRSAAIKLKFVPENGMKVIVSGSVNVYVKDGSYQLYVSSIQPDGVGALYIAFEQLKARLDTEGLFDQDHKKPIPEYPSRIGVITSPTGAAIRDIINVIGRRFPLATIYLYPSLVQGAEAEDSLIRGLDYFDTSGLVDTVIIGRGGGSIEDLWAFNGEKLARRIYSANIPIISAVGHEVDFTICDFVADLRAPTPSAAAELAVPDVRELLLRLDGLYAACDNALNNLVERWRGRLKLVCSSSGFADPYSNLKDKIREVRALYDRAGSAEQKFIDMTRLGFNSRVDMLSVMNPLSVLIRGYSVVEKDGRIVRSTKEICVGDSVSVRLADGSFTAEVAD